MNPARHQPPVKLNESKVRSALGDPDSPGFVLLTIAMWAFGDALLGDPEQGIEPMDPAEVWAELHERFGTWVSEEGENKLNALTMALAGDLFYRDIEVFQAVCTALYDGDLGDLINSGFEDLSVTEIMWAILEVELARSDEEEHPHFSPAIQRYIDSMLSVEQEQQDAAMDNIREAYQDMLGMLKEIGVPVSAIRMLDEEYADTLEFLEAAGEISPATVS
jgi:hypothetical protein